MTTKKPAKITGPEYAAACRAAHLECQQEAGAAAAEYRAAVRPLAAARKARGRAARARRDQRIRDLREALHAGDG